MLSRLFFFAATTNFEDLKLPLEPRKVLLRRQEDTYVDVVVTVVVTFAAAAVEVMVLKENQHIYMLFLV